MAPNELIPHRPRIGWFYDGLPDEVTPPTATMLQDNGSQITLTIPWRMTGTGHGQIPRWFHGDTTSFGDDPDRTKYSYEVPTELSFGDVDGAVALVGCRSWGMQENLGMTSAGQGVVRVQLVVLGTNILHYDKVNGVRTEIPELAGWVGLTSIRHKVRRDSEGRARGVSVDVESPDPISLSSRLNLRLVPSWSTSHPNDGPFSMHDEVFVETRTTRLRRWDDHLEAHRSVRELVDISAWAPFGYRQVKALRDDDPVRLMSGESVQEKWADVRTYAVRAERSSGSRPNYMFVFSDMGAGGYRRWQRARERFARGVIPLLALLDAKEAHIESHLTQSSIGLEAIGYQLALDSGASKATARREPLVERLRRLNDSLAVDVVLPGWPQRASDAYNGVKHANRAQPAINDVLNVVRENILVFRTWVATVIGVPSLTIAGRLWPDSSFQSLAQQGAGLYRPIVR